jgi:hypothetical protein
MWILEQRQRFYLEHHDLQNEGFAQFGVYYDASSDAYWATGIASASSGREYRLHLPMPAGYPNARPPMYVTEPSPLKVYDGRLLSSLGTSHQMHTLEPHSKGWPQICHWRDSRWHARILLQKVFLKGLIWIEAYEQHLTTGRPIADFVATMAERT